MRLAALPRPDDVRLPDSTLDRLYRVRTLAQHWDCSKPMIFKLLKAGLLTSVKLGTELRITEASALEYLRRRRGAK